MNKATITTAIAAAILALSPAVTNADHRDTETESMFNIDSHCFVRDNNDNQIKLDHFWQFTPDYKPTSHSGTSSMTILPCIPTVCPDGYWMASGWLCTTVEPWAASPARDHSAEAQVRQAAVAVVQAAIVGPDVGPLLPFAPIGYKATT
jgi:hypothetical protein